MSEGKRHLQHGLVKAMIALLALTAPGLSACAKQPQRGESFLKRMFAGPQAPTEVSVTLRLVADIDLPGPLPEGEVRVLGDRALVPVAGGYAVTAWEPGSVAVVSEAPPAPATPPGRSSGGDEAGDRSRRGDESSTADAPSWSMDPSGLYRARFRDDGTLIMQRRCRFLCSGWDKIWKLSVPGSRHGAPLLTESRVYFGGLDNRVYSLQKRSGDRIWASDIQERPSRPVKLWEARPEEAPGDGARRKAPAVRSRFILVLPDAGSRLLALDRQTGKVAARFEIREEDGTLKGHPVTTPDGRILVARERYRADQASLMVFELVAASAKDSPVRAPVLEEPGSQDLPAQGGSREKKNSPAPG